MDYEPSIRDSFKRTPATCESHTKSSLFGCSQMLFKQHFSLLSESTLIESTLKCRLVSKSSNFHPTNIHSSSTLRSISLLRSITLWVSFSIFHTACTSESKQRSFNTRLLATPLLERCQKANKSDLSRHRFRSSKILPIELRNFKFLN